MGKLQSAFEAPNTMKDMSFLGQLFSSPIIRGSYKDEKPVVDVKLEGSKNEQLRMTSLINTIANNSPTGRQILQDAAKAGYTFGFECQPGSYGFCDPSEKKLCLNPMKNDAKLITTLAHEARHAQQNTKNISAKFCSFDVATELKLRRAAEADAQAAAAQTALEIRATTRNEKIWKSFEKTDKDITDSISMPSLFKSLDSVVADREINMRDAFKGWFKNERIVDLYEQSYLYNHLKGIETCETQAEKTTYFKERPFKGSLSSAEILNTFCVSDGKKCYFANDLNIMDREPEMCGICQETRDAAKAFFAERAETTGVSADKSYEKLPDRASLFKSSLMDWAAFDDLSISAKPAKKPDAKNFIPHLLNKFRGR